jgi:hypothetical protein
MTQRLITGKKIQQFQDTVNAVLATGATIVPGSLSMTATSHRKRDGAAYLQSRYAVVVEGEASCFTELEGCF